MAQLSKMWIRIGGYKSVCLGFNETPAARSAPRARATIIYCPLVVAALPYSYDNERYEILIVRYLRRSMRSTELHRAQHP